jgi:predicted NUDIX family phosphoesterase
VSGARVFVVDRAAFFAGAWPHGFVPLPPADAAAWLRRARAQGRFEDRATAEHNPNWKQLIPYCVLRCGGSPTPASGRDARGVFCVQRTTGQSEGRLHGRWSIGIGGHIEPEDDGGDHVPAEAFFERALRRELDEELHLGPAVRTARPVLRGLLNDDSSAVGQVHAGLVYTLDLPLPPDQAREVVEVREISKMRGGFGSLVDLQELWQDPAQFESWSHFLLHAGIIGPMDDSVLLSNQQNGQR